ncbi:MAG: DUF87 domain-containing protein [Anaerolineae bacterium]|nr:DUF87 domain-containing protein [Anaerolineae bacterium]
MPFIEAPTTFYMGRRFDPTTRRLVDEVVYYDSRDLTTHAVVVGMTGSGKTGLCITLLEEAVMDNIPSIIIDPKGDITNLLLSFPDLKPQDFEPWVNIDDARRAGLDVGEYAVDVAQQWRDGLASWGITSQRVAHFKQNARFSIYTPGSDAGLAISILDAMQAPRNGWQGDEDELHRERISGIVTALLALIGKTVVPVQDREHVLIANIFEYAWRQGHDLTLEDVILQVQKPPFAKLGVFDVDTFFPEKDRFALAMELNNIIASPSFQSWLQGEPMDIQSLLYTPEGKPRVSIFYIAHLNDAERMFIVTLLLENMLAWMRTLSGTTSLRAILYFDEVYGFFPPHPYNPPSKDPILRLLKQARAFGLGLVIATQNPGDIDYKGLANAGTWFIGKLQTENDKNKVLSGLQSMTTVDTVVHIDDIDRLLGSIDPRVFVMNNVHDNGGPVPIHTRWAMSFLRGPLTRQQIRLLMSEQRQQPMYPTYAQMNPYAIPPQATQPFATPMPGTGPYRQEPPIPPGATPPPMSLPEMPDLPGTPPPASLPGMTQPTGGFTQPARGFTQPSGGMTRSTGGMTTRSSRDAGLPEGYSMTQPPLPSNMAQHFLPSEISMEQAIGAWERQTGMRATAFGGSLIAYRSILLGQVETRYTDRKSDVNTIIRHAYHVPHVERAGLIHWEEYEAPYMDPKDLSGSPFGDAAFGDLSPGLSDSRRLTVLKGDLVDYIYKTGVLTLMFNSTLDLYGQPDMRRRDFLVQAQTLARQRRDEEIDKVTAQYEKHFDQVESKLRRAARDLAAEQKELEALKSEEMFTTGEAVLSLLRGRTTYTLSRVSRTRRYKGQAKEQVYEAESIIAELEAQLDDLQARLEEELAAINAKWGDIASQVEEYKVTPYKKDIYLSAFGIGWKPHWMVMVNNQITLIPAWGTLTPGAAGT